MFAPLRLEPNLQMAQQGNDADDDNDDIAHANDESVARVRLSKLFCCKIVFDVEKIYFSAPFALVLKGNVQINHFL